MVGYWTAGNLCEARRKIYSEYDGKTWAGQTEAVMPILLNETVRNALPEIGFRRALDIGCGVGRLMRATASRFQKVYGIDMTPSMVELSAQYLEGLNNTRVFLCDGRTIPMEDESIDFVYSMITFQHIPSRSAVESYLAEARRVLKPGGVVRIQNYKGYPAVEPTAIEGYYYPSARAFAEAFEDAGLKVLEEQEGVWHENHIWVTGQKEQ
jgi:ubiquinone/menaquinone biosynthesis C-methylase UbiE